MRHQREFKTTPVSRALLEAEVRSLWKQIENNKTILIRPYATLYSAVLLPIFLYQFLLKGDLFKDIRETMQEHHRQVFSRALTNRYIQAVPASQRASAAELTLIDTEGRDMIKQFEKLLLGMPLSWPEPELVVRTLRRGGYPQATLANYAAILRSIPYRMQDLAETKDQEHLLYYTAVLIDGLYRHIKDTRLINRYHNVYAILSSYAPGELTPAERQIFPEYTGPLTPIPQTPGTTTCLRYAQLIHLLVPYYYLIEEEKDFYTAPYVLNRLGAQILWLSIGLSLLLHLAFIPKLLRNIAGYSRLLNTRIMKYFLPMGWYLDRPLTVKNYRFLETDDLAEEKRLLTQSLKKQAPYVKKSKLLDKMLTGIFLIYCAFNLLFTGTWSDQTFALIPILAGIALKNIFSYSADQYAAGRVAGRLQALSKNLERVFSQVTKQCVITQVKRDNLDLSYVTIQVLKKYENLPEKYLASVLKNGLNHFGVQISTHDETSLSVAADAHLHDLEVINVFFQKVLAASVVHYQLGQQLKPMMQIISSTIDLEPSFLDPAKPEWLISAVGLFTPPSTGLPGVTVEARSITIQRQTPFSASELAGLKKIVSSAEQKVQVGPAPTIPVSKSKKSKPAAQDMKSAESAALPQSSAPPLESITWPIANVRFPENAEVKPVSNAVRRFMFFPQALRDSGDNKQTREALNAFYVKSTQMARSAYDSQGIKEGHYFGTDFFTGQQTNYQGRIKVLGKYGNSAVFLSVEKAPSGARLYQARSFATGVHRK